MPPETKITIIAYVHDGETDVIAVAGTPNPVNRKAHEHYALVMDVPNLFLLIYDLSESDTLDALVQAIWDHGGLDAVPEETESFAEVKAGVPPEELNWLAHKIIELKTRLGR